MHRRTGSRRATPAAAALLITTLVLTGCSSGGSSAKPSTTPHSSGVCAWPTKADRATENLAYPDTSATYWVMSFQLAPGEQLELRNRFPEARYLSFITYGPTGGARDVLTDQDIVATPKDANPFAGGTPASHIRGSYTVRVSAAANSPTEPNVVSAAPTASAPAGGAAAPARNPVGSGVAGKPGVTTGSLIYRVYLSNTRGDPTGGAGLPAVRVLHRDGTTVAVPTCAHPGKNPNAEALVRTNGPATDRPVPTQPVFIRPDKGAATLYPNPDNVYVATILGYQPGRIVVVRGRAPTFPDTGAGKPITGQEQVRYWSLCTNEYRKPYPVTACVPDQDVTLDASGNFTFVVSTPADRPANATAANGVTWLDWGSTKVNVLLLLRNMLANPDFAESAIKLPEGALATSTMGPYAPHAAYCPAPTFASGGPAACPTPG